LSTQTDALADLGLKYRDLAGLAPEPPPTSGATSG